MVSLIMPAWRPRRDWLLEAVSSALGQRDCALELIVVDDGSPEPIEGMLASVEDERLRVVRVAHGGPNRARNAGMEVATGDHVRFVDSDDVFELGSTARLLRLAAGERVIAYGATAFCDESLTPIFIQESDLAGDVAVECLLDHFPIMLQSVLFPRAVLDSVGGWDPEFRVSGDWDYALRAFEQAPVRGDQKVATLYRQRAGSVSKDVDAGMEGARRVVERYLKRHPEHRGTALERRALAMLAVREARSYAGEGRLIRSLRSSRRALTLDPDVRRAGIRRALPALQRGHLRAGGRRLVRRRRA